VSIVIIIIIIITGKLHVSCNLEYQIPKFFLMIFHNLSGYDSHLFIKKLKVKCEDKNEKINCIAKSEENYITFSKKVLVDSFMKGVIDKDEDGSEVRTHKEVLVKRELRFIDSYRFMLASLDDLTKSLSSDQCKNLKKFYPNEKQFNLLRRKRRYPYDWVDSIDKLAETSLPSKDAFYSRLKGEGITDEDYKHAREVWDEFETKTFREYHELYNKTDVLQLADENFRDVCLENYGLDPTWYYTSPGLSWDAMLKCIQIKLELLGDHDMLLFIKKGICGGISMV